MCIAYAHGATVLGHRRHIGRRLGRIPNHNLTYHNSMHQSSGFGQNVNRFTLILLNQLPVGRDFNRKLS